MASYLLAMIATQYWLHVRQRFMAYTKENNSDLQWVFCVAKDELKAPAGSSPETRLRNVNRVIQQDTKKPIGTPACFDGTEPSRLSTNCQQLSL
jgi:hypothetical protein